MLKKTPLAAVHERMGGRMVDFAGWSLPVNYGSQIDEHHAVRRRAGLFDVSHMTIIDVLGDDATTFLRFLLANDVMRLQTPGKALYSAMLNAHGGVLDDLIVYRRRDGYRLIVNCATREKDLTWLKLQSDGYQVTIDERPELALIAVQGPLARTLFSDHCARGEDRQTVNELGSFAGADLTNGWFVARTGYTGEDGLEIMLPESEAEYCWTTLVEHGATPCGLGARDTLRLEAGMNLYGHEMDDAVSPLVANMAWTIAWDDARDFIGKKALEEQKQSGIKDKLVGLRLQGRGVLREGYAVHIPGTKRTGTVTSGTFSPTLGYSIALARVPVLAKNEAQVMIRGKLVPCDVVKPCFVRNGQPIIPVTDMA